MTDLAFHTLDVFTDRLFGGNPLAVFPQAPELDDAVMQAIAREFNLSETVFVRPPRAAGALARLRIFTPAEELPFAGHPTVGTAHLLVELGLAPRGADGSSEFAFEEGVGLIPVSVAPAPGGGLFTWMTAARVPERGPAPLPREVLAAMLGLAPDDVLSDGRDAPALCSVGVPFLVVPLRDRAALARARLDVSRWQQSRAGDSAHAVYLFCDAVSGAAAASTAPVAGRAAAGAAAGVSGTAPDIHARMFAPAMGIAEDAATGSAAAAFVGYLHARDGAGRRWIVSQGEDMGRPSTLHVEAVVSGGRLQAARVGGSAVRVSRGTLSLPHGGA